jgi:outer membrane beta-barrel protein
MHLRFFFMKSILWIVGFMVANWLHVAVAQEPEPTPAPGSGEDVENILEQTLLKDEQKDEPAPLPEPKGKEPKLTDLSGLAQLAPFSDVAVIQKKFLPKTKRFEFFPGLGIVMNDAFFLNVGLNMRLAYFFNEAWGVEAAVHLVGTSEKQITKDLSEKRGIVTRTLVSPQGYYGGAIRWTPVYGKMGYLDKSIVPFDLYLLGGFGLTKTNQNANEATFHIGTGQTFALKKWMAARWELSWYTYQASTTTGQGGGTFTNLWATVGVSFFFPGAKYR